MSDASLGDTEPSARSRPGEASDGSAWIAVLSVARWVGVRSMLSRSGR
jgi:hypothetical protein